MWNSNTDGPGATSTGSIIGMTSIAGIMGMSGTMSMTDIMSMASTAMATVLDYEESAYRQ